MTLSPFDPAELAALHAVVSGVRMLVVDDDPMIRKTIARTFARTSFQVMVAEDGAPALELASETPPDLAIVDFHMPTPGLDVVRQLRSMHGAAIWIAVLTGSDEEATRSACFLAGADDVLAKPITMQQLRRKLIAAARSQQAYVESRVANERADRRIAYGAEAAAMLAHDLNNGLTVALSNLGFVREAATLDGDAADALGSTLGALRRMSVLVANFVDIARFEDAAVKPAATSTPVRALLEAVVDVHRVSNHATYEIDCAPELTGYFDAALIERVLHNLVGNAGRYCRGGLIRIRAFVWDPYDPTSVEVAVFNTGKPVPDDIKGRLFKKYAKGSGGQRGFGLYFSRLACEAHGGSIEYRDEPGGACFAFRLPGRR